MTKAAKQTGANRPDLKKQPTSRSDGRRAVTLYLDPDLMKRLKRLALDRDTTAYELAEVAISAWLDSEKA
jgi:hypothetical protein